MKPLKIVFTSVFIAFVFALCPPDLLAVGTVEGTVTEGNPFSVILVQAVTVEVMSRDESVTYSTVLTDVNGDFTAPDIPAGDIRVYFRLVGYVETFGDYTLPDNNSIRANVSLAPDAAGTGTVSGNFIDATLGPPNVPIDGVSVTLYQHINQTSGTVGGSATSAADGSFSIAAVPNGTYTLVATHPLFTDDIYQVVSVTGQTMNYTDLTMSPQLAIGEIRIVMSWGYNPTDLDSHLYTPDIGGSTYHVFFADRGSLAGNPYAELDRDDVDRYGPETITIAQSFDGQYDYYVHNYAAEVYGEPTQLSSSGCVVKVYDASGLFATFYVPAASRLTSQYNWWVFSYNGTTGQIIARDSGPATLALLAGEPESPGHSPCFIQSAAQGQFNGTSFIEKLMRGFR